MMSTKNPYITIFYNRSVLEVVRLCRNVWLVLVFVLFYYCNYAQEPISRIIGTESGLPSPTVYKIDQDSKGVLWIATDRGICSYDGYEFRTYKSCLLYTSPSPRD